MVYSPENEICLIIYSTSCYSKPLWHSFFCRKYFEEYFHHTIKVMGLVQNNIGPQWHFSNDLMFHSRKFYQIYQTYGMVKRLQHIKWLKFLNSHPQQIPLPPIIISSEKEYNHCGAENLWNGSEMKGRESRMIGVNETGM